jgi:hypothetical protein
MAIQLVLLTLHSPLPRDFTSSHAYKKSSDDTIFESSADSWEIYVIFALDGKWPTSAFNASSPHVSLEKLGLKRWLIVKGMIACGGEQQVYYTAWHWGNVEREAYAPLMPVSWAWVSGGMWWWATGFRFLYIGWTVETICSTSLV